MHQNIDIDVHLHEKVGPKHYVFPLPYDCLSRRAGGGGVEPRGRITLTPMIIIINSHLIDAVGCHDFRPKFKPTASSTVISQFSGYFYSTGGSGKTFEYYFHYRQTFLVGYPEWINGTHMDDLYSIFGWPYMEPFRRIYLNEDFEEMDLIVSERIMNYYSNFVRTGYTRLPTAQAREFQPLIN